MVWQMQGKASSHAGGAAKNQLVEDLVSLMPGKYTLHYKSDAGHAYNNWDSEPPVHLFWGIIVFAPQ